MLSVEMKGEAIKILTRAFATPSLLPAADSLESSAVSLLSLAARLSTLSVGLGFTSERSWCKLSAMAAVDLNTSFLASSDDVSEYVKQPIKHKYYQLNNINININHTKE
jgi:hypothetical protein